MIHYSKYLYFLTFFLCLSFANAEALPKLIDLGAKKCIPCKQMAPILEDLSGNYAIYFETEFIDVWMPENKAKAVEYKIKSIPTQVFLDKEGVELFRHVGFMSKEAILAKWKELGVDVELKVEAEEKEVGCAACKGS